MKTLLDLGRKLSLRPVHKMLLANTGSMTCLLEALFGEIAIKAETQRIVEANPETAGVLDIRAGEQVNYRAVRLIGGERVLVHATSYAPLSRLHEGFKADMMKTNIPIGRILAKHRLESRREVLSFDSLKTDERFAKVFSLPVGSVLLERRYNIIHLERPLMHIIEVFPYEIAGWAGEAGC